MTELFTDLFRFLAEDPNDDRAVEFAEVVWEHLTHSGLFPDELDCDDDLVDLGLARYARDEDGDTLIAYRGTQEWEDYFPAEE